MPVPTAIRRRAPVPNLDTERTLLEFQLGLERAMVDRATSYAQIERLVGAEIAPTDIEPVSQEADR